MNLSETTILTSADFPVAEFGAHLRLGTGFADDGTQDTLLEACLRAAMGAIEARTGKILIERGFRWGIANWRREAGAQALPVAPVSEILSVEMIAADGSAEVVDPSGYGVQPDLQRPKLVPVGAGFPEIPTYGRAEIGITAGYGAWSAVPADLRQAMLMLAATYYENREAMTKTATQIPMGISALLEPYRRMRIGGGA